MLGFCWAGTGEVMAQRAQRMMDGILFMGRSWRVVSAMDAIPDGIPGNRLADPSPYGFC